jgi:hypothetical protein
MAAKQKGAPKGMIAVAKKENKALKTGINAAASKTK